MAGFRMRLDSAAIQRAADRGAGELVEKVAENVAESMRNIAPVDTTALVQSIGVELQGEGATTVAFIGPDASFTFEGQHPDNYALFLEYGTSRMAAQPFMEPALMQNAAV